MQEIIRIELTRSQVDLLLDALNIAIEEGADLGSFSDIRVIVQKAATGLPHALLVPSRYIDGRDPNWPPVRCTLSEG